MGRMQAKDEEAVAAFQEFVRIPSISGDGPLNGSYQRAVEWLQARLTARIAGIQIETIEPVKGKPIVIAKLVGSNPELPSILLNSHYDVVPVINVEQDMKCVCVQYIEAIHRLQQQEGGWTPVRTVYLTYVPDEEIGGKDGINKLLETPQFEAMLPIALALDEGLACDRDAYTVFYGERVPWWILIRATGPTGHGSRFVQNTATEKLMEVVNKALAFRKEQEREWGG